MHILNKVAAVLAFAIGAMAIFAGGKVLLGILPDYSVIDWLPVYNFALGVVSLLITAPLIWKKHKLALPLALATLVSHSTVMFILQTVYRHSVAPDSLAAMTLRISVWVVVVALLVVQEQVMPAKHRLT